MMQRPGWTVFLILVGIGLAVFSVFVRNVDAEEEKWNEFVKRGSVNPNVERDAFIQALVEQMTPEELAMQLHMTFADSVVGPNSDNSLFSSATRYAPIGVIHDWYPLSPPLPPFSNISNFYNALQSQNILFSQSNVPFSSHVPIPSMQLGECLHGVGSFKQSMFPSPIMLAASWDEDLVWRVGRAIGSEARSVGIHACLCPVLDLGKEVRWGRVQEAWGEDLHLTTSLGVAFSLGLSNNASHSSPDAVVPVVKHFIGHGSPSGGINAAPYTGSGVREYLQEFFRPFKAVLVRGGGRGVMMAYHEFDSVPAHTNPLFYDTLDEWGFDGFVMADDTGVAMLQTRHLTSSKDIRGDTVSQWLNAGGGIQFYDFSLDDWVNTILFLLNSTDSTTSPNSTIPSPTLSLETLQARAKRILNVKWDLGLFRGLLDDDSSASTSTSVNALVAESHTSPVSSADSDRNSSLFLSSSLQSYHETLTAQHAPLTLEAARKGIALLENRVDSGGLPALPIQLGTQSAPKRIALIGPFSDMLNFGDYAGPWGASPASVHVDEEGKVIAGTIREGILGYIENHDDVELVTSTGTNTWLYNAQYGVPGYLLSPPTINTTNQTHGLLATYFSTTNFSSPVFSRVEVPNRDWGLYPPYDSGLSFAFNSSTGQIEVQQARDAVMLPSNNFSVIWEGQLEAPLFATATSASDLNVINGFIGVAVGSNSSARLWLDDELVAESSWPPPASLLPSNSNSSDPDGSPTFKTATFLGNILPLSYSLANATIPPPGAGNFAFEGGRKYRVRIEYQAWNLAVKIENVNSVNAQVGFWWNLVEQGSETTASNELSLGVQKAAEIANTSDLIILAVGANWNSDGESGDRGTLGLSANQTELADAIFDLGIPVVLVLQGGRPFAIPEYYEKAAAVLNSFFPGQSGGQAIADVLFGAFNPGGRISLSVPYDVGTLPVYYNYHLTRHALDYTDIPSFSYYPFGYGLSYTTFSTTNFNANSTGGAHTFSSGDTITFRVTVTNQDTMSGSYVAQVYLLPRVSNIVRPVRQLVAFKRVYLDAGDSRDIEMSLDVDEFLPIVNRKYEWELERGEYTFALLENGGSGMEEGMEARMGTGTGVNVTMVCMG
ncbi:hypothetical protein VKT23_012010 [Stygiomarasmius scandens]|uniref:xylan 1,4-beta-xylosidase n=1 Tax=Marasmiellus scandens TaxID=2682957 RepID=A0ABR1J7K2_9AGAR